MWDIILLWEERWQSIHSQIASTTHSKYGCKWYVRQVLIVRALVGRHDRAATCLCHIGESINVDISMPEKSYCPDDHIDEVSLFCLDFYLQIHVAVTSECLVPPCWELISKHT